MSQLWTHWGGHPTRKVGKGRRQSETSEKAQGQDSDIGILPSPC